MSEEPRNETGGFFSKFAKMAKKAWEVFKTFLRKLKEFFCFLAAKFTAGCRYIAQKVVQWTD